MIWVPVFNISSVKSSKLQFNITYFDIVIEDPIMGSNITNFQDNVSGAENKSQGIELSTNWTDNDRLNMGFNYTFTKSYSGMDCDKPEKDKWGYTQRTSYLWDQFSPQRNPSEASGEWIQHSDGLQLPNSI